MHTLCVITGGLILMVVVHGAARLLGISILRAYAVFVVLWAVAAAVNLWAGVIHAGYTVEEELPIFAIVFLAPCIIAWLIGRRLS